VLDKYLKDRKDKILDLSEINTLENTIRSLKITENSMEAIDALTKEWI
jgi:hypothetical protein